MTSFTSNMPISPGITSAAEAHLHDHQTSIWKRTDRLLAWLLIAEWAGAIALALLRSPRTWSGTSSSIHPHLLAATLLGGAIVSLPVMLAFGRPGQQITRHTIALGQMLMSGLLIHLGDGRIEMHFHVFGSLAFLTFYRDWRVLITATVVVAADHLLRGLFLPESVYGVVSAPIWRTVEHAWWVVFEDIFLIASCLQSVREMRGIALNRALLEQSYQDVEKKVVERTAELKNAQQDLLKAARSAGMADIATSVLHNVGNVLNSVNVSATLIADKLKQSEVASLSKVGQMIGEHQTDMTAFLTNDERGKMIPEFITELATCLNEEQQQILGEVESLSTGIEHIKRIVTAQQSMAKKANLSIATKPISLIQSAISMTAGASSSDIRIDCTGDDCPELMMDQHKVLQILINLLSNARHAVIIRSQTDRVLSMSVELIDTDKGRRAVFRVGDNGMGIEPEHLTRIFSHGFTTKKEGHGFGLHGAANAAREMGGELTAHSEGKGKGATFTLEIPALFAQETQPCRN